MSQDKIKKIAKPEIASDAYDEGIRIRQRVLGKDYVEASLRASRGTLGEDLQTLVTENVWGRVWSRPGLSDRDRSLLNIGILVAMNQSYELSVHIKGGINNGLSEEEISEAIIHTSVYCGAPVALAAMRTLQETLSSHE
jgi:4-carboxymuconolactone decarboxylase